MPTDILVSNAGVISEYGPKLGDTNLEKFMDDMVSRKFPSQVEFVYSLKLIIIRSL
jgi:hypothetical protein